MVDKNFESDLMFEVKMRLLGVYMSEDDVVEFLVEGNMVSDNHFMYFLLKAIFYPIIILLCSVQ